MDSVWFFFLPRCFARKKNILYGVDEIRWLWLHRNEQLDEWTQSQNETETERLGNMEACEKLSFMLQCIFKYFHTEMTEHVGLYCYH